MNKNSELARLYEAFSHLSAKHKTKIVNTVEALLEQQEKGRKMTQSDLYKEKNEPVSKSN